MIQSQKTSKIIQVVKELMQQTGYSDRTINRYNAYWNSLLKYEGDDRSFSTGRAVNFLDDVYNITAFTDLTKTDGVRARAIQYLCKYSQYGSFSITRISSGKIPGFKFTEYLEKFKEYQTSMHIISETSLKHYDNEIGHFLLYLTQKELHSLEQLSASIILDYCNSFASFPTSAVRHNAFSSVRVFLRFLLKTEAITEDLSSIVPSVPNHRDYKIPTAYSEAEKESLLNIIDRSSPISKRDYAIIMVAARLELLSSDIRLLAFSSVKWEKNTIELVMEKTKELIVLPLLNDIGEALIDYIRYVRPQCDLPYIFVSHVSPTRIPLAAGITAIVKKHANKVGIDCTPYGKGCPHALRSTLVTHLLENEVPLPVISEILGHKDTRTTEVYLYLDIVHLRKCCLEVPMFDWNKKDQEVF